MSEPLVVIIPHQLGKEEALRRIKPALGKASHSFPILQVDHEVWSGERMDFRLKAIGQVAVGNVQVGDTHVRLEVTLPWLLHKIAAAVQNNRRQRSDTARKEVRYRFGGHHQKCAVQATFSTTQRQCFENRQLVLFVQTVRANIKR